MDTGECLFSKAYSRIDADGDLVSGFLSALSDFSQEISGDEIRKLEMRDIQVVYERMEDRNLIFVLATSKEIPTSVLSEIISETKKTFFESYDDVIVEWRGDITPYKQFDKLFEKILEKYGTQVIAMPVFEFEELGIVYWQAMIETKRFMSKVTGKELEKLFKSMWRVKLVPFENGYIPTDTFSFLWAEIDTRAFVIPYEEIERDLSQDLDINEFIKTLQLIKSINDFDPEKKILIPVFPPSFLVDFKNLLTERMKPRFITEPYNTIPNIINDEDIEENVELFKEIYIKIKEGIERFNEIQKILEKRVTINIEDINKKLEENERKIDKLRISNEKLKFSLELGKEKIIENLKNQRNRELNSAIIIKLSNPLETMKMKLDNISGTLKEKIDYLNRETHAIKEAKQKIDSLNQSIKPIEQEFKTIFGDFKKNKSLYKEFLEEIDRIELKYSKKKDEIKKLIEKAIDKYNNKSGVMERKIENQKIAFERLKLDLLKEKGNTRKKFGEFERKLTEEKKIMDELIIKIEGHTEKITEILVPLYFAQYTNGEVKIILPSTLGEKLEPIPPLQILFPIIEEISQNRELIDRISKGNNILESKKEKQKIYEDIKALLSKKMISKSDHGTLLLDL